MHITKDMIPVSMDKECNSCVYGPEHHKNAPNRWDSCNYILMTGKRRNCPVGYCDKYEKRTKGRKNNFNYSKIGLSEVEEYESNELI